MAKKSEDKPEKQEPGEKPAEKPRPAEGHKPGSKPDMAPKKEEVINVEPGMKHFVRILNTDLAGNKAISVGMKKIKGVGFNFANMVCNLAKIEKTKKTGHLTDAERNRIEEVLKNPNKHNIPSWMLNRRKDYQTGADKHLFVSDLDFSKQNDLRTLQRIKSNRGLRHAWGLPVRGQKTKSNFRKNKGKALGVKRKKQGKT
jgi:small subunit ribosomal protein S13